MRVLQRIAYLQKQMQSRAELWTKLCAPAIKLDTLNKLGYQIRHALFTDATINQPGDMGMIELRQHAAFLLEAFKHICAIISQNLDGDVHLEHAITTLGAPNFPHSTPTQQVANAPWT